ncbi:DUF1120 domain-containing protein [Cupriavidus lacunae]|uniref:Fimbrial-type adhesion domain-containing protein n=1 Tax=Cupriavidus lacunae TaxID=2666307 RepID=A0A370NKT8_9BURK|nr:DUF1120 domain-containing protein [Cupriavidus lacunae]RDK06211.1 hypothetical protein DN412_32810 [Cupriavidus lacunae]
MKTRLGGMAAAILFTAAPAWAGPTAEISFVGEVLPTACQISAGAQTTVDYGNITRTALSATDMTQLPSRPISALTVQCDSQTSIGLRAVDNRSGVIDYGALALAGGGTVAPAQTDRRFSLGQTSAGKPVGVWAVAFSGASVDGVPADIGVVAGGVLRLAIATRCCATTARQSRGCQAGSLPRAGFSPSPAMSRPGSPGWASCPARRRYGSTAWPPSK